MSTFVVSSPPGLVNGSLVLLTYGGVNLHVLYVCSFQWKSRLKLSEKLKVIFWYQVVACLREHNHVVVLMNLLSKLANILFLFSLGYFMFPWDILSISKVTESLSDENGIALAKRCERKNISSLGLDFLRSFMQSVNFVPLCKSSSRINILDEEGSAMIMSLSSATTS